LRDSLAACPRVAEYSNPGLEDGSPLGKFPNSSHQPALVAFGIRCNQAYETQWVSQVANAIHALVPEIISRSGCDKTISSPPHTVARWRRRCVIKS